MAAIGAPAGSGAASRVSDRMTGQILDRRAGIKKGRLAGALFELIRFLNRSGFAQRRLPMARPPKSQSQKPSMADLLCCQEPLTINHPCL